MAKANITRPDGTTIHVEGSSEEIKLILSVYSELNSGQEDKKKLKQAVVQSFGEPTEKSKKEPPNLVGITNKIKSCGEAEQIEKNILDKASGVNKALLPLFISNKYFSDGEGLSSGDVHKILSDLGVGTSQSNIAHAFSGPASRYLQGDKARKRGQLIKYKINRRGMQYLTEVLGNS